MDARDFAANKSKWYESFNETTMEVDVLLYDEETDEEEIVTFPVKYDVCHLCEGKGTHVHPSIDAHGISASEFYDDPHYADDYFNGVYDVTCYECNGERVVPIIDEKSVKNDNSLKEKLDLFNEQLYELAISDYEWAKEREMELKMCGCW